LQQFQLLLPGAQVRRAEHLLDGGQRCVYQIIPLVQA
jgi:predicted ArsR family transcriptional regulator